MTAHHMHHAERGDNHPTEIANFRGLTMSSVEIAALTGKRHLHVLRDIRRTLSELHDGETNFGSTYTDAQGKQHPMFNLPKRETLVLVSGYSVRMRARIIDRWQELEDAIASRASDGVMTGIEPDVRQVIGGIVKAVLHRELTEVVPALVRSEIASSAMLFRHGRTAGQIWAQFGFPKMRVTSWFSNRLCEMGCQIEGSARAEIGGRTYKMFDPDKADLWIRNGGRALVEAYIAKRGGQKVLHLVGRAPGN